MRKSVVFLTVLVALACTAVALAARPPGGSFFKGVTNADPIKGSKGQQFRDPVKIRVAASGKRIKTFKTGIPSCFGSGGPPPKENPYTKKGYAATFKSIPIKASGKFRKKQSFNVGAIPTTATVSGKFAKRKGKWRVRGKIVYRQSLQASDCGPVTMRYVATRKR